MDKFQDFAVFGCVCDLPGSSQFPKGYSHTNTHALRHAHTLSYTVSHTYTLRGMNTKKLDEAEWVTHTPVCSLVSPWITCTIGAHT